MEIKRSPLKSAERPTASQSPITHAGDLEWQENFIRCTHCGSQNTTEAVTCSRCNLALKYENREYWYPSKDLLQKWFAVRSHYDDNLEHLNFVEACLNSENILFGLNQYRRILAVSPHEPTAKAMSEMLLCPIMVSAVPNGRPLLPQRSLIFNLGYGVAGFMFALGIIFYDFDLLFFATLFLAGLIFGRRWLESFGR